MATKPNLNLVANTWHNIKDLSGIVKGTPCRAMNVSSAVCIVAEASTQPDADNKDGFLLLPVSYLEMSKLTIESGSDWVWVKPVNSDAVLAITE